ncbi:prolyl oligopeptidase family serine peptidase [Roseomonas elaeocarpi]|uniref:Prolyl oligopeptidase family protein n=1 Tax=Roseomonas elaeocarpi TaxID=907779 RepID=A0ABV6K2J9_9PROT
MTASDPAHSDPTQPAPTPADAAHADRTHPDPSRPSLAHPDEDPWIWLEEVDGERALDWVEARNRDTLARLSGPGFERDRDALKSAMDRPDRIPHVTRRGGLLYNFWQDAEHPRGLWRRTTLDSYRDAPEATAWEVLLDLDALATTEGEDWVWHGADTLAPAHERAMLSLSRGGGDAHVIREFDLATRTFVPGGFDLPECKGGVDWIDRDTILLSAALGEGMVTDSGYPATVRVWRRGTAPEAAAEIFRTAPGNMGAWGGWDRDRGEVVVREQLGFFDVRLHLGDAAGMRRVLDLPTDMRADWSHGWLVLQPRTDWTVAGTVWAADTVLGIGFEDFLGGGRALVPLFEPAPRRALQSFRWYGDRLLLSVLDDLRPVVTVRVPAEGWRESRLAGLPEIGVVSVWPLDAEPDETDGTLLASVQDPITPPTLLLTREGQAVPEPLRQSPALFDATGLVVSRHEAVSTDGERIPYVQIGPADTTGEAPVHMTGYGGFQVSVQPYYSARLGQLWLERGGTGVITHLRGGGEFGTRWHEAGRLARKRLSHDDFAAVAKDLVERGVTRPGRIAAEGGSNGGLLIANMLTRYPERFGALFCTIPLVDMRRYTKLLAGASWVAEYGDPDKPEDWAFLGEISAYHHVEAGRPYPPILLATARRDDRVHPAHARKMAARLQALGYDAGFYEPAAGGHGYGKDSTEIATFSALGMRFLRQAIGWEDPAG